MIELLQQTGGLIGSLEDIRALSQKNHARILVVSDTHTFLRPFRKIIEKYGPNCDALIFAGDGVDDICSFLEEADIDEEFRNQLPPVLAFVHGNNDERAFSVAYDIGKNNKDAKDLYKGTVIVPSQQILSVNGHNILIVHGAEEGIYYSYTPLVNMAKIFFCDTIVCGHTHVPGEITQDGCKIINPGSLRLPRKFPVHSFAIMTVEKDFIDTAFIGMKNLYSPAPDFEIYTPPML